MKKRHFGLGIAFVFLSASVVFYLYWPAVKYDLFHNVADEAAAQPQYAVPESILRTGQYPATPEAVLHEYLRLDAEGAYLSDAGLNYLKQLSPRNSGMREKMIVMLVINGYKVKSIRTAGDVVEAEVEFQELGELVNASWFYPWEFRKSVNVRTRQIVLSKFKGRWVVSNDLLYCKISATTASKYIDMFAAAHAETKGVVDHANKLKSEIIDASGSPSKES